MPSIFTKIVNREIPAKIEHEDEFCIVIHDIHPKAPVHLLIVPKKEIPTIMEAADEDQQLLGHLLLVARNMGQKLGLEGYKLQFNVGSKGGQEIFHILLHLMGG
ncbi:HIT domain-containing protein [Candidatus Peregrinibacteria bacterium]|nr:HIT domain-containing protein [Candidatus Peregrinibacteria bacterium]